MGKSLWGGSDEPSQPSPLEDQMRQMQPAPKGDPLQNMIMSMIAKNPAIAEAFSGIQGMMQEYLNKVTAIEETNQRILAILMGLSRETYANAAPTANGEARGVIADGVRCPWCGSAGECHPDCPSHGDAAGTGDPASAGPGGLPGSGGGGNLNSGGDPVSAASGTGA